MRGLAKTAPMAQTDRQTDGHGKSMTKSAQGGRVGENPAYGRQRNSSIDFFVSAGVKKEADGNFCLQPAKGIFSKKNV